MCKTLIEEYNRKRKDEKLFEGNIANFINYIINNRKKLSKDFKTYYFWEEYGEKIFEEVLKREEVKKKFEVVYKVSDELKKISCEIRDELVRIPEDFEKSYMLSENEVYEIPLKVR